jgi:hypothetical protein
MKASSLLKPLRFRFTEDADAKAYGDDWVIYDEAQIVRLPARALSALEVEIGLPLLNVMQGMRDETVMGHLAGSWLALHLVDPGRAGSFDDYSPVATLIEWERVDGAPKADMSAPLDSTSSPSSPQAE